MTKRCKHRSSFTGLAALFILGLSSANAVILVDGTKDTDYGDAVSVQAVETQFGDNQSEWNAAYARIESGRLFLMFTGNLESNFNKLEIFIDSKAGGQSIFDSAGNDNANRMDGLVFDAGFTADYHLIARRGTGNFDLDFADLTAQTFSSYLNVFGGTGAGTTGTGLNGSAIGVAYDDSNTAGVLGGTGPADQDAARAVTTGFELSLALPDIGYISGPLNIMLGQNGDGHHYWSNQFLGSLQPPQGNLGGDEMGTFTGEGAINLQNFTGDQFFTIPEPSSAAVLAVALLTSFKRPRRAAFACLSNRRQLLRGRSLPLC